MPILIEQIEIDLHELPKNNFTQKIATTQRNTMVPAAMRKSEQKKTKPNWINCVFGSNLILHSTHKRASERAMSTIRDKNKKKPA